MGMAFSLVKKEVTGSWSGAGATSAELETLDSLTNDVIAVAVDEKAAGYGTVQQVGIGPGSLQALGRADSEVDRR